MVNYCIGLGLGLLTFSLVAVPSGHCYQERVILSAQAGVCTIGVEADDQSRALRLRVHPEGQGCRIEKEHMLSALKAAASKDRGLGPEGTYSSLSIGRLIDYPWLSQSLVERASKDLSWDKRKGRPQSLDINRYVSNLLLENGIAAEIGEALGGGYQVTSIIVEKVLVGLLHTLPNLEGKSRSGKVPVDAQVWFKLGKSGGRSP